VVSPSKYKIYIDIEDLKVDSDRISVNEDTPANKKK
jgi:hypothetical protein